MTVSFWLSFKNRKKNDDLQRVRQVHPQLPLHKGRQGEKHQRQNTQEHVFIVSVVLAIAFSFRLLIQVCQVIIRWILLPRQASPAFVLASPRAL